MRLKRQGIALFCALLIAMLSACGQTGSSSESSEAPVSSAASSEISSSESPSSQSESHPEESQLLEPVPAPEGSQVFRGTVEDFAVSDDGSTVLLMRRASGTNFPADLKVKLADDTQFGVDETQLGNGSFLEIYYSPDESNEDGSVTALAINGEISEDSVYYNGTVVEIVADQEREGEGYILMDPLTADGMQYQFNYGPETQFSIPVEEIAPGVQLNVYHSPVATRSLPPQSYALEIGAYIPPEAGEASIPAAEVSAAESVPAESSAPSEILSPSAS